MPANLLFDDELADRIDGATRFIRQIREADADARTRGQCVQAWIMTDVRKAERRLKLHLKEQAKRTKERTVSP